MKTVIRACVGMVCCTVLIGVGLYLGYNGTLLSAGLAIIGGLAGYVVGKKLD